MRVSASDVAAWHYCPRSFYYDKVEKRKRPINENLVKGILIHVIYENFFVKKLFLDETAFDSFIDLGLDKEIEKETGRINSLKMDRDNLKKFLVNSTQKLLAAFKDGRISIPTANEQKVHTPEFIARIDSVFDKPGIPVTVADVKIKLRNLGTVKLQLAVAAIILEKQGKKVVKGLAIDAESWREIEVDLTDDVKKEVWDIREKILDMYESREKPVCACGRCDLAI